MKWTDDLTDMAVWFQFLFGWGVTLILLGWCALLVYMVWKGEWIWFIVAASGLISLLVTAQRN